MTAAVLEKIKDTEKPWVMPKPCVGQTVLYYSRGLVSPKNAVIAFVSEVSQNSIVAQHRSIGYDGVMHVDDPRLQSNPDLRDDIPGLWDFTDSDKALLKRVEAVESQIEKLLAAKEDLGPVSSTGGSRAAKALGK